MNNITLFNYKKFSFLNTFTAFTLAEVLITLLIIGIVASIVIPTLIQDTQEIELHTAWKKAYSDLDQTTRRIVIDNAGSLKGLCAQYDSNCLKNLYAAYLNINKTCNANATAGICWHENGKFFNFTKYPISGWGYPVSVILTNGNLVRFEANGFPDCTNNTWIGTIPKCAFINVDINGFKGPNTVGRDIYFMILTENKLLPVGTDGGGYENDCNANGAGYGCATKYLYQ